MDESAWNHNVHYHNLLLAAVPQNCMEAFDVGCGRGLLARELGRRCARVTGIDPDAESLASAITHPGASQHVKYVSGDAMVYPFPLASFDVIAMVASLHHLPLTPALQRFRSLQNPAAFWQSSAYTALPPCRTIYWLASHCPQAGCCAATIPTWM